MGSFAPFIRPTFSLTLVLLCVMHFGSAAGLPDPDLPALDCGTPTETSITVLVTKPASGVVEKYVSTCSSCGQSNTKEKEDNNGASFTYNNLESFKEYTVEVQAVFKGNFSDGVQVTCKTKEAAPEAVEKFDYVEATLLPDEITLKWTKPLVTNGIILRYELTFRANGVEDAGSHAAFPPNMEHTFTGLKAGYDYTFTIRARTKHHEPGEAKTLEVMMPLGKPFCQEDCATTRATVAHTDIESSSVRVKLRTPFSDRYGKVDRFTIIVSTTNKTKAPKDLMTWAAAKNQISGDRFYAAIWECDIFDESEKCWDKSARKKRAVGDEITIPVGEEGCDTSRDKTYCNGPLDEDTNYFFTLRGHTVGTGDDLYQDTAVSSPVKTKESSSGLGISIVGLIVGLAIGLFICVLLVGLLTYLFRRNKQIKKRQRARRPPRGVGRSSPLDGGRQQGHATSSREIGAFSGHNIPLQSQTQESKPQRPGALATQNRLQPISENVGTFPAQGTSSRHKMSKYAHNEASVELGAEVGTSVQTQGQRDNDYERPSVYHYIDDGAQYEALKVK